MNYRDLTLGDWIEHINEKIEDETTLDGNEMRDLVKFLITMQEPKQEDYSTEILSSEEIIGLMEALQEQESKTGHWIWCVGSHKCSNCEEYTCFSHKELLRYCPNCGAKMSEIPTGSESEG